MTVPHAQDVSGLQHFLLDVARRYVVAIDRPYAEIDDLLACAAALDYVLLVCREHEEDRPTPSDAVLDGIRGTIERGIGRGLDFIGTTIDFPDATFREFAERHAGAHGIFPVLSRLRADGAQRDERLAYRAVALANDIATRRARVG